MSNCACRTEIEQLRAIMEQTYNLYESFTDPAVLSSSQRLDDALVDYRNCPCFEYCSLNGNSRSNGEEAPPCKKKQKRIAG